MTPHALDAMHPGDADLLRVLDGETDALERADAATHAATCAACAARMQALHARRVRLGTLLAATDAPVPALAPPLRAPALLHDAAAQREATWRRGPVLRAAAALLLVAGAAFAAEPAIGRWMARQLDRLTSDGAASAPDAPRATPAPAMGGAVVAFTPAPGPFAIRFDARQAGGTLTIVADTGAQARAARTGEDGAEIVVLPSTFVIRNTGSSTASYRVAVPAALGEVRVRIGDGMEIVVPLFPGASRVVPLATRED